MIFNNTATNVWLALDERATVGRGILLKPGAKWDQMLGDRMWTGKIDAVDESGQPVRLAGESQ